MKTAAIIFAGVACLFSVLAIIGAAASLSAGDHTGACEWVRLAAGAFLLSLAGGLLASP